MTCGEWTKELVECVRRDGGDAAPDQALRAHLSLCAHCRERWDAERQLTDQLRSMRTMAVGAASLGSRDIRRESLMRDFSLLHRRSAGRSQSAQSWVWGLSAAAALVLAVLLGHFVGQAGARRTRGTVSPATRTHEVRTNRTIVYEANYSLSNDASALSSDDFIAVPYTPPLAPGEMVRVVHADLYPEALASMGVGVDPSWTGDLPAEVLVGEDGLPRAVRITENGPF